MEKLENQKPFVGGQAVLEGVMMRSPRCLAIAVRRPNGELAIREDGWVSLWEELSFLRWPFVRGTVVLVESMMNGIGALNFSARQAELKDKTNEPAFESKSVDSTQKPKKAEAALGVAISILMALAVFVALPHVLAYGFGALFGKSWDVDSFAFHAVDGVFKVLVFIGYIRGISVIPEIRRVFEYHGAEHKVVNAYENDLPLTLDVAKNQTTFHARCGTSFILVVLLLSVFVFSAVFPFVPKVSDHLILNHLAMILIKIPLMPPLAGLAYELNRYAARHPGQAWVKLLILPGKWMQGLTTREPDDAQLEVALAAMQSALRKEASLKALSYSEAKKFQKEHPEEHVLVFKDFASFAHQNPS